MIKYRFAKGKDGSTVDVTNIDNNRRYEKSPYICFGCGTELIANLGQKRIKHFSHKYKCECSNESYLHSLAKENLYSAYKNCLLEDTPFVLKMNYEAKCTHFINDSGLYCKNIIEKGVDLTKHFKHIKLEKHHHGFVPDILLSNENNDEFIFLEIAVTHKCEKEKIESKFRILEVQVNNEDEALELKTPIISELQDNINIYNFNKITIEDDVCKGSCKKLVNLFVIFDNKKSTILKVPFFKALGADVKGNVVYSEILSTISETRNNEIPDFKNKSRELFFENHPLKNCYLCKYHREDVFGNDIYCKQKRKAFKIHEAIKCKNFIPFSNLHECRLSDERDKEYISKNFAKLVGYKRY